VPELLDPDVSHEAESDEPRPHTVPRNDELRRMLAAAVEAVGGSERAGQVDMAEAVGHAISARRHLLVQAGTGTGKSLAYLVPALMHDEPVIVSTARARPAGSG